MGLCSHSGWAAMALKATAMDRKAVVRVLCFIFVFVFELVMILEYENISKIVKISSESKAFGHGTHGFYGGFNGFIRLLLYILFMMTAERSAFERR